MSDKKPIRSVGVVGLGHMGLAFAENLRADGYQVRGYERNVDKARAALGEEAVESLADLADCDVVLTSLPNDDALAAVTLGEQGLTGILRPGAVHVSTSTISPDVARRVAKAHEAAGQYFVSAPVLGNPTFAKDRKLYILVAGAAEGVDRAHPMLERLGQRAFRIGDDPGLANLMKLAGNALTATTLQCLGEVLALVQKGGIDAHLAFDVLTNSLFDGQVHKAYGAKIVDQDFSPPGMAVPLALKDVRLALNEAEQVEVPMPATSLVRDRLVALEARGWSDLDWSALGLQAAADAGLEQQ